jgi:tetratricopeptide (TPR) repeat protein
MNDTHARQHLIRTEQMLRNKLAANPRSPSAMNNLALTLRELGRSSEAERLLKQALRLAPDVRELSVNLAMLQIDSRRYAEAETLLRRVLSASGFLPAAGFLLGRALRETGREDEAEAMFRQVITAQPDFVEAHRSLGDVLMQQNRKAEAEAVLRQAIECCPGSTECRDDLERLRQGAGASPNGPAQPDEVHTAALAACTALIEQGVESRKQGRTADAEQAFNRFVETWPDRPEAHLELAVRLMDQQCFPEAAQALRSALAIHSNSPPLEYSLSLLLLRLEQYDEGWLRHESRLVPSPDWKRRGFADPIIVSPAIRPWHGESLTGQSLAIVSDQGLGDMIQFVRYARFLKRAGAARITVVTPPQLSRLLSHADGVDACVETINGADVASYDRWCYMMSVPHLMGASWPGAATDVPYISVPAAQAKPWVQRMKKHVPRDMLKVGIVWEGSAQLGNRRDSSGVADEPNNQRSIRLSAFEPCLRIPGIRFFSLQKGAARTQLGELDAGIRPVDWMPEVRDMLDTAAIVDNLDLVISVDTSVLHLAGALGKPVWGLMRHLGDWRWRDDRDDSPWYPSLRMFRQTQARGWTDVIVRVEESLRDLAQSRMSR